jgi:hypothetical protein
MPDIIRWTIVLATALVLIGLAAYGRGDQHHHRDDVGSHGTIVVVRR